MLLTEAAFYSPHVVVLVNEGMLSHFQIGNLLPVSPRDVLK